MSDFFFVTGRQQGWVNKAGAGQPWQSTVVYEREGEGFRQWVTHDTSHKLSGGREGVVSVLSIRGLFCPHKQSER